MFEFILKIFVVTIYFFSCDALKFVSINNQESRTMPQIKNINSNEPTIYPISIELNKCSGSCNNFIDPYRKLCVPVVVKNMNVKVFNPISRTNETRHTK